MKWGIKINRRLMGKNGEQLAAGYLTENGYFILKMNYNCRIGEIDIIATKNNVIIFVEVKYRNTDIYGYAIEAVGIHKQNKIRRVAQYFLISEFNNTDIACRFDVIGIDGDKLTHIENAF